MADQPKYTLLHPVQIGEEALSELVFTRIKAKQFRYILSGDEEGRQFRMLATLTGRAIEVIEELDAVDFVGAIKMADDFLGFSQVTGDN